MSFRAITDIIERDPGKRGIANLIIDGEFERAARVLAPVARVVILTGFPCLIDLTPPTETDGPPGALAIARAVVARGGSAVVCTDVSSQGPMEACARTLRELRGWSEEQLRVRAFPPCATFAEGDADELRKIAASADVVIAIERAGVAADGKYYTMRGRDMTPLVAPLELAFDFAKQHGKPTIGIGDGGNELGMGKVVDAVRSHVTMGDQIACVKAADLLIACGVSNWGGYGLAAALAVVDAELHPDVSTDLSRYLPSAEEETDVVKALVEAGAKDGISRAADMSVDGMSHETHLGVIRELAHVATAAPAAV